LLSKKTGLDLPQEHPSPISWRVLQVDHHDFRIYISFDFSSHYPIPPENAMSPCQPEIGDGFGGPGCR
jgi:hypothetical protein